MKCWLPLHLKIPLNKLLKKTAILSFILYTLNYFNLLILNHILLTKVFISLAVLCLVIKFNRKDINSIALFHLFVILYITTLYWQASIYLAVYHFSIYYYLRDVSPFSANN